MIMCYSPHLCFRNFQLWLEGFTYDQCLAWLQNCQYAKQGLVLLCASIYQKKHEKTLPGILPMFPHDGKERSSTRAAPEHLCSVR